MTAQVLFFNVFSEEDPHLNAVEFDISISLWINYCETDSLQDKVSLKQKPVVATSILTQFGAFCITVLFLLKRKKEEIVRQY